MGFLVRVYLLIDVVVVDVNAVGGTLMRDQKISSAIFEEPLAAGKKLPFAARYHRQLRALVRKLDADSSHFVVEKSDHAGEYHYRRSLGPPIPRKIFTYWAQGLAKAPLIVRASVAEMKRKFTGWDVVVLSEETLPAVLAEDEVQLVVAAK